MSSDTSAADDLFTCQRCGVCCRGYGGTYLTEADVAALAAYLDISAAQVRERYCDISGGRLIIKQGADGYCIFWDELCSVHPVKPRMCRAWPFIDNLLRDIANWKIMAANCPGMRTDVSPEAIRECVRQTRAALRTKPS